MGKQMQAKYETDTVLQNIYTLFKPLQINKIDGETRRYLVQCKVNKLRIALPEPLSCKRVNSQRHFQEI